MGLFRKELRDYKILERYKKTLDDFYMFGETEAYRLYLDKRLGQYILRQEKQKPKNVIYLGWLRGKYCVYHGKIFFIEAMSYTGRTQHPLKYIDIETGNSGSMSLLSDKGSWIAMHWHCQDVVREFSVENDVLVLKVFRYKENVHSEEEMTYFIHISYTDDEFKVDYIYP